MVGLWELVSGDVRFSWIIFGPVGNMFKGGVFEGRKGGL